MSRWRTRAGVVFLIGAAILAALCVPGVARTLGGRAATVAWEESRVPALDPIGSRSVTELTELAFTATASDADLPALDLSFSLGDGAPTGAAITSAGAFTWTPTEAQGPGTYDITIVVSNGTDTDSETISVEVAEANVPPVLDAIGNKSVAELTELAFMATATDADLPAQTLSFSLGADAPAGAAITADGAFTWTPSEAQGPGTHEITVIVSDGEAADSETISVEVAEDDLTAPTTSIAVNPATAGGLAGWYLIAPTVTLTADEPATISYSFGDTFDTYSVPVSAPEGSTTLRYYAVDSSGNTGATRTRDFTIDLTDPTPSTDVTATALGTGSIRLSWTAATDTASGIWRYHVYNGVTDAFVSTVFGSTVVFGGLTEGTAYSYYVVAEDRAGRLSAPSAMAAATTLVLDTVAPTTTLAASPAAPDGEGGWYVTAPTATLTCDEPGTTYYSLGGSFTLYTAPFALPAGQYTLSYYSTDLDSNQETAKTSALKVDLADPSAPMSPGATAQSTTVIRLTWTAAADSDSGMWRYRIYNAATDAVLGTVVGTGADISNLLPATAYTFYVRAQDNAGRLSAPSTTFSATTKTPVSGLSPMYRFYNVRNGTHFYTPNAVERDMVIATWPNVFTYEGIAFYTNPASNAQPLYRFYNRVSASHFYTASVAERDMVIATWPGIFTYEGETFLVSPTPVAGATTVYRFYNRGTGSHFYTASAEERDHVIVAWPHVFTYEGPVYWLAP